MLYITTIVNLPKHFFVICKFQYIASYIITQVIDIYIKSNKGPNTDPSGTPLKTDFQFESSPCITTRCFFLVRHFSIQSIKPSLIT